MLKYNSGQEKNLVTHYQSNRHYNRAEQILWITLQKWTFSS